MEGWTIILLTDDCTANGNTRQKCQYSVSTLSYNMTFAMWDPTSTYTLCDTVAVSYRYTLPVFLLL